MKYSIVPPWRLPSIKHCSYFTGTKQDLSDEMIHLTFLEQVEEHNDSVLVFTDGSKSDVGVGFGVAFPNFCLWEIAQSGLYFYGRIFCNFNCLEGDCFSFQRELLFLVIQKVFFRL